MAAGSVPQYYQQSKGFLQNLIREHDMPPKPVLEIDMAEFRTMQKLMIKAQDKAKEIRHLQDTVLPKLKQQLADTKGIFKGKERKALTEQIQRTEKKIAEKLDKLPDVLKEDGYPDVQAYMATYRKAEAVVEQFNRDLAAWEQQVREKQKPAKKEQAKPPERESLLKRLRQLQAEGKQRNQPRQRNPLTETADKENTRQRVTVGGVGIYEHIFMIDEIERSHNPAHSIIHIFASIGILNDYMTF